MNEIKSPRKQQITYILMVAVVMILLNSLVMPYLQNAQITETDYNTFINMTENGQVKEVEICSRTRRTRSTPPRRSRIRNWSAGSMSTASNSGA